MTRRSKREVERALEDLDDERDHTSTAVVFRDQRTGELVDRDGEPADPDADRVFVVDRHVVMHREKAESEGREILGPAEDVPSDRDVVRVVWEGDRR